MKHSCVFCDRAKLADRIIAEREHCYIVATLGQIVSGYLLLIPKTHVSCWAEIPSTHQIALRRDSRDVYQQLKLHYEQSSVDDIRPAILFEHGIVGQTVKHAHRHFVPVTLDLTPRVRADFPKAKIIELETESQLARLYHERPRPYLFWSTPAGKQMVCWNPPAPPAYLRLILAEALGVPERGDWRTMDQGLDKKLAEETVYRFSGHL